MSLHIGNEIQSLFERWLLDRFEDEFHTKEQMHEASIDGYHWSDFAKEVKAELDK